MWQVVEKQSNATDWTLPRTTYRVERLATLKEAAETAERYLTELNGDNALTVEDKNRSFEAFMVTDEGILLGNLDGDRWLLANSKGQLITNLDHRLLEGKTEVRIREMAGRKPLKAV